MSAPYHCILSKTDRALVAYLLSQGAGAVGDLVPAKRSARIQPPCTIIHSTKADDVATAAGTFLVTARIQVLMEALARDLSHLVELEQASNLRFGKTCDALNRGTSDDLSQAITAAARSAALVDPVRNSDLQDFTCLSVTIEEVTAGEDESGRWIDTINLKLVCVNSDVEDH